MFRNKRSVMLLLTAVIAISAAAFISLPKAEAADTITILIDGKMFQPPDAPPFIASDRVMVPFRPIAEAIGATADWNGAQQKVSVSLANRYLEFVIGSNTMLLATTDANGGVVRTNVNLDAPATLVNNNRAFVPLRALSEGLGATVQWVAESKTVIITSNIVRATPTPMYTPTPAVNPVFATTSNFEIVSGRRVQEMNNNNNHEVVFYFDSADSNAVNAMSAIMQAARTVNAHVYGVDIRSSSGMESLNWVYSYVSRSSQGPALLFLYSRDKVMLQTAFNDQKVLDTLFSNWYRNSYVTPSLTPTPRPTGTISPSAAPLPEFYAPFIKVNKHEAEDMYDYGDRFILLFFNNERSDFSSSRLDSYIKGVYDADEPIYYMNDADQSDYTWFGEKYFYDYDRIPNPCIFYVSNSYIDETESRAVAKSTLADDILRYLRY